MSIHTNDWPRHLRHGFLSSERDLLEPGLALVGVLVAGSHDTGHSKSSKVEVVATKSKV